MLPLNYLLWALPQLPDCISSPGFYRKAENAVFLPFVMPWLTENSPGNSPRAHICPGTGLPSFFLNVFLWVSLPCYSICNRVLAHISTNILFQSRGVILLIGLRLFVSVVFDQRVHLSLFSIIVFCIHRANTFAVCCIVS